MFLCHFCIALQSIRHTVGERNIRLDVKYRRFVTQIGSENIYHRLTRGRILNAFEPYTRKPKTVRTKRGTRCENAYSFVAAETRRTNRKRRRRRVFGKLPYKPNMRELFESSYALTLCKFRLEHYFPLEKRAKSALTRYAEFFTEIGSYMRYRFYFQALFPLL